MKVVLSQINFTKGAASTMSVTYTSVLPVREETVDFLAGLLAAERLRRGTRAETWSLSCHDQAVLVLRWFLDGTRMSQLVRDNPIGKSTGYDYLHEGIDVLAVRSPSLPACAERLIDPESQLVNSCLQGDPRYRDATL
jgi:hypothetical protein